MINPELVKYVGTLREQNIPEEKIKAQLLNAGWSVQDIESVMVPGTSTPVPPPPVPRVEMWVGFLYIILFITLYVSATALASILKFLVDQVIPDVLSKRSTYSYIGSIFYGPETIIYHLSAMIVTFPIFAFLFLFLKKQQHLNPAVRNLRSRKLLIYLTLVITFLIMIFDLISTVYGFLNGTVTGRSISHFAITMLVSGSIFGYYVWEVKEDRRIG